MTGTDGGGSAVIRVLLSRYCIIDRGHGRCGISPVALKGCNADSVGGPTGAAVATSGTLHAFLSLVTSGDRLCVLVHRVSGC